MDRASLDRLVTKCIRDGGRPKELKILARQEVVGLHVPREIVLSEQQFVDLCKLHFADWANLVLAYSFWHYRRDEYKNIAVLLATRFGYEQYYNVYLNTMATEPADSAERKEVPEMVRARQLGIADKVISGEIAYEDLQSHKLDKKE
jgi:hypothetical protein